MKESKYQQTVNKIIESVPDIRQEFKEQEKVIFDNGGEGVRENGRINLYERDITLEDILSAIPEEKNIYISAWTGLISIWSRALGEMVSQHISWQLNKSLENQNADTIDFLYDCLKDR